MASSRSIIIESDGTVYIEVDYHATPFDKAEGGAHFVKHGKIESDGTVRAANGNKRGKIDYDGTVYAASHDRFGKVESDGTAYTRNHVKLGKVGPSAVRCKSGSLPARSAAAYYFFFCD